MIAGPASSQSIGRQMDLLRLEQDAGEAVSALVDSDFKTCEAKLPALRALMADPRFDRMRAEIRRPFLFSVIICSEIKDKPLGLAAAAKLEPIAVEPMEVGAVLTIQISDALERDAMAEATRRFLKMLDAQPDVVIGVGDFGDGGLGDRPHRRRHQHARGQQQRQREPGAASVRCERGWSERAPERRGLA